MLRMRTKVGVMGSAGGNLEPEALTRVRELGRYCAERDCIVITGACPGYPQQAVLGAREAGGLAIGVSPAHCLDEHIERYHSPWEEYELLVFTGSGLMGREIEAIRSCDIVVTCGGRSGTLGEFAIAYDEGKLIGVLAHTGGISDHMHAIVGFINKQTGAEVLYDQDPRALVDKLLAAFEVRLQEGRAYGIARPDG